jgi:hypothetical protein
MYYLPEALAVNFFPFEIELIIDFLGNEAQTQDYINLSIDHKEIRIHYQKREDYKYFSLYISEHKITKDY